MFGNYFLKVPLIYRPWRLVPCCQSKLVELTKQSLQNLLYTSFCLLICTQFALKSSVPRSRNPTGDNLTADLPVMVFIHGGSFIAGSNVLYDHQVRK